MVILGFVIVTQLGSIVVATHWTRGCEVMSATLTRETTALGKS